jgi:orotidine-5'-phosphate decarboxylase
MSTRLIIALDFHEQMKALELVDQLDPGLCILKIGSELFTREGPSFVKELINKGFKVFLDLKFFDIPSTVARACAAAADLGVWMLNVHTSGGEEMMIAAKTALMPFGNKRPWLIGVTVLTSFKATNLTSIGVTKPLIDQVSDLAQLAKNSGLDGVVCSPHEIKILKQRCSKEFIVVTPGVRPVSSALDDQFRVMTPKQALDAGSDYIVIGRPITRAINPMSVVEEILNEGV